MHTARETRAQRATNLPAIARPTGADKEQVQKIASRCLCVRGCFQQKPFFRSNHLSPPASVAYRMDLNVTWPSVTNQRVSATCRSETCCCCCSCCDTYGHSSRHTASLTHERRRRRVMTVTPSRRRVIIVALGQTFILLHLLLHSKNRLNLTRENTKVSLQPIGRAHCCTPEDQHSHETNKSEFPFQKRSRVDPPANSAAAAAADDDDEAGELFLSAPSSSCTTPQSHPPPSTTLFRRGGARRWGERDQKGQNHLGLHRLSVR